MTDEAPTRLFDPESGAPSDLRGLLDAAHTDVLSRDALARVTTGVEQAIAPPPGPAPPAPATGPLLAKASLVLVIGGMAIGALALRSSVTMEPQAAPNPVTMGPQAVPNPVTMGSQAASNSGVQARPAPVDPGEAPEAPGSLEPAARASSTPPAAPAALASSPRPATSPPAAALAAPSSPAIEEHLLLRRARAALATDPAQALALAREHERRFPRGMLAEEREVIAIEALARSGSPDDAQARLRRFKADHPASVHGPSLDRRVQDAIDQ